MRINYNPQMVQLKTNSKRYHHKEQVKLLVYNTIQNYVHVISKHFLKH